MQVHQTKIWVKDSHKRQRGSSYDYTYYIYIIYIHIHIYPIKLSIFQHWARLNDWLVIALSQLSLSQPTGEAWWWDWRRVLTIGVAFLVISHPAPPHPQSWSPQDPRVIILAHKRLWWLGQETKIKYFLFTVLDSQYLIYCKCMWILS